MKVYQIVVKKYEPFQFYLRNGMLTLTCDERYPIPCASMLWNKDNTWTRNYITIPTRITVPASLVRKKDYYNFVEQHLLELIKEALNVYGVEDCKNNVCNIFFFKKDIGNGMLEVGMCYYSGRLLCPNKKLQKLHDSLNKLKAFW